MATPPDSGCSDSCIEFTAPVEVPVVLPTILHHQPVRVRQRERDGQQQQDLEEVGQPARVLERVGRVGVEEATTVRTELLDRLLRRHRAALDDLLTTGDRGDRQGVVDVLDDPADDEQQGCDGRERQ